MSKRKYEETDGFSDDDWVEDDENVTDQNEQNGVTDEDVDNEIVCIDLQLDEIGEKSFNCL